MSVLTPDKLRVQTAKFGACAPPLAHLPWAVLYHLCGHPLHLRLQGCARRITRCSTKTLPLPPQKNAAHWVHKWRHFFWALLQAKNDGHYPMKYGQWYGHCCRQNSGHCHTESGPPHAAPLRNTPIRPLRPPPPPANQVVDVSRLGRGLLLSPSVWRIPLFDINDSAFFGAVHRPSPARVPGVQPPARQAANGRGPPRCTILIAGVWCAAPPPPPRYARTHTHKHTHARAHTHTQWPVPCASLWSMAPREPEQSLVLSPAFGGGL